MISKPVTCRRLSALLALVLTVHPVLAAQYQYQVAYGTVASDA